jgi:hypothetical protein
MPHLLATVHRDTIVLVQDTTVWVIGRFCELHFDLIPVALHEQMLTVLIEGLKKSPQVAHQACFAMNSIALHCGDAPAGSVLRSTEMYKLALQMLVTCADRPDREEADLRVAAYVFFYLPLHFTRIMLTI